MDEYKELTIKCEKIGSIWVAVCEEENRFTRYESPSRRGLLIRLMGYYFNKVTKFSVTIPHEEVK